MLSVNPQQQESRHSNQPSAFRNGQDLAGAAILLEIGVQYDLIELMRSAATFSVKDITDNSKIPQAVLAKYLNALVGVGLLEPCDSIDETSAEHFRTTPLFEQTIYDVGYLSWGLLACAPLIAHAREFAKEPDSARRKYYRDGGLVARTSAWMGDRGFYPQAEKAVIELQPKRIVDLGAGSAKLLIRCLKHLPNASGVALDVSDGACAQARKAAAEHGVSDRLEVVESSIQALAADSSVLKGADVIHAGFVFHDLMPKYERELDAVLMACRGAAASGTLLIQDAVPFAVDQEERVFSTAFSYLHDSFMGQTLLSQERWLDKLKNAGFAQVSFAKLGLPGGRLITASTSNLETKVKGT